VGSVQSAFEGVLAHYWNAKTTDTIRRDHPVCVELATVARLLGESKQARRFPNVLVKWSAGQGNWATIPWIAALDTRETSRTSEGVYVVYLFRADMSGVYLTLSQGTTRVSGDHGRDAPRVLRDRAVRLRARAGELASAGFDLSPSLELGHDSTIVRSYEAATVASKVYARNSVPADAELLKDFERALQVYDALVPSRRIVGAERSDYVEESDDDN